MNFRASKHHDFYDFQPHDYVGLILFSLTTFTTMCATFGLATFATFGTFVAWPYFFQIEPGKKRGQFFTSFSPLHGSGRVVLGRFFGPGGRHINSPPEATTRPLRRLFRFMVSVYPETKNVPSGRCWRFRIAAIFAARSWRRCASCGGRYLRRRACYWDKEKPPERAALAACGLWPKMIFFQNVIICFVAGVKLN